MPERDYTLMHRYWLHEPWGQWRDNFHAAIIAAEIRRPNLKRGAKLELDDFMLRSQQDMDAEREEKRRANARNLFATLKAMAKRKSPP